jgi:hypothetical protein
MTRINAFDKIRHFIKGLGQKYHSCTHDKVIKKKKQFNTKIHRNTRQARLQADANGFEEAMGEATAAGPEHP